MKKTKEPGGITLIALVITIIVLLILAGISIMMLTGDNSILNRATEAKENTIVGSEKEAISVAYNGVLTNTKGSEVTAADLQQELRDNGNNIEDIETVEEGMKVTFTDTQHVYIIGQNGEVTEFTPVDRTGINIGDYVTYIQTEKNNYITYLTSDYTGYNKDQEIGQEFKTWRILNKNDDGSLDLIPAFNESDLPEEKSRFTSISFGGAKGFINSVYILDDICSYLYADESKGITARSIDYEDITSHMIEGTERETWSKSDGLKKISKYQIEKVNDLSMNGNITNKQGITVTYKNNTYYPELFPNIKDDLSSPYYTSSTFPSNALLSGKIAPKPDRLTVERNDYSGKLTNLDFIDSKVYEVIFETNTYYWLASRGINCGWNHVFYTLIYVRQDGLDSRVVYYSDNQEADTEQWRRICPVIHVNPEVDLIKSSDPNDITHTHILR